MVLCRRGTGFAIFLIGALPRTTAQHIAPAAALAGVPREWRRRGIATFIVEMHHAGRRMAEPGTNPVCSQQPGILCSIGVLAVGLAAPDVDAPALALASRANSSNRHNTSAYSANFIGMWRWPARRCGGQRCVRTHHDDRAPLGCRSAGTKPRQPSRRNLSRFTGRPIAAR